MHFITVQIYLYTLNLIIFSLLKVSVPQILRTIESSNDLNFWLWQLGSDPLPIEPNAWILRMIEIQEELHNTFLQLLNINETIHSYLQDNLEIYQHLRLIKEILFRFKRYIIEVGSR